MAVYLKGRARYVPVIRGQTTSVKLANNQIKIMDSEHDFDENINLTKLLLLKIKTSDREHVVYPMSIAALTSTPSILAAAFTTPNPSIALKGTADVLGDLANGTPASVAAFQIFHCYLQLGQINTSRFVPWHAPFIPTSRSSSGRYNFEIQATCYLLGKRLEATRFLEVLMIEIDRGVSPPWATTKKPKPLQPAEEVLESLEASLPFSTYVWKLLTERVLEHRSVALRNSKVARIIEIANEKAQQSNTSDNSINPNTASSSQTPYVGSLVIEFLVDPGEIPTAQPSITTSLGTSQAPSFDATHPTLPTAPDTTAASSSSRHSTTPPAAGLFPSQPQRQRKRKVQDIDALPETAAAPRRGMRERRAVPDFSAMQAEAAAKQREEKQMKKGKEKKKEEEKEKERSGAKPKAARKKKEGKEKESKV